MRTRLRRSREFFFKRERLLLSILAMLAFSFELAAKEPRKILLRHYSIRSLQVKPGEIQQIQIPTGDLNPTSLTPSPRSSNRETSFFDSPTSSLTNGTPSPLMSAAGVTPSPTTLPARLEVEELKLAKDSQIELPPFESVRIRKLIAEDGARIKFPILNSGGDGATGPRGSNGKDAKAVRLFVDSLDGHIVIESRGGDGGDGVEGKNGLQGADGKKGRNGGKFLFFYLEDGSDGKPGERGQDGENGGDGGDGGRGGKAFIFFKEKTANSKFLVDVGGGRAGAGGIAGMGGLGGNGGKGGKGIKEGKPGLMGASGKAGQPGRPGKPGAAGEVSIYQTSARLFNCLAILDLRAREEELLDEDYLACIREDETSGSPTEMSAPVLWTQTQTAKVTDSALESATGTVTESNTGESDALAEIDLNADGADGDGGEVNRQRGNRGGTGADGGNAGQITLILNQLPQSIRLSSRGGKGGDGAMGATGLPGFDGEDGVNEGWFNPATSGKFGGYGGPGGSGGDGGRGGDGARIRVIYVSSRAPAPFHWQQEIKYDIGGGSGGFPGRGGDGGRAGRGGLGGYFLNSKLRAPNGGDGVKGLSGQNGQRGASGKDGEIQFLERSSFTQWIVEDFREQSLELYPQTQKPLR